LFKALFDNAETDGVKWSWVAFTTVSSVLENRKDGVQLFPGDRIHPYPFHQLAVQTDLTLDHPLYRVAAADTVRMWSS
jgi:hypothetical protein